VLEKTILSNLILNEEYSRKVFPYLKEDYFDDTAYRKLFSTASDYVEKYKEPPSKEALRIALDHRSDLNEDLYSESSS
jgi:replicative DNA helicase